MNNIIKLEGLNETSVTIDQEAFVERDRLIAVAAKITVVDDDFSKGIAVDIHKAMKVSHKLVEDTRKEIKKPVLEIGKAIDAAAKKYLEPLEAEGKRVSKMMGDYEVKVRAEQAKIEAEQKAKIKAEEARIRQEAEEAARIEREATEKRIKESKDAEEAVRLQNEADVKARLAKEEKEADIAKAKEELSAPVSNAPKVTLRTEYCYEVTDIDLLASFHPELVDVTPNKAAIKSALKQKLNISGIKAWTENKAS